MKSLNYKTIIAIYGQDAFKKHYNENVQKYIKIVCHDSYTPKTMAILKELFEQDKIESYPQQTVGGKITWLDANSRAHRVGLPAALLWDQKYIQYNIRGQLHREDGPARIRTLSNGKYIQWCKKNVTVAEESFHDPKTSTYKIGSATCSLERYKEKITQEFPSAGDKIFYKDFENEVC